MRNFINRLFAWYGRKQWERDSRAAMRRRAEKNTPWTAQRVADLQAPMRHAPITERDALAAVTRRPSAAEALARVEPLGYREA